MRAGRRPVLCPSRLRRVRSPRPVPAPDPFRRVRANRAGKGVARRAWRTLLPGLRPFCLRPCNSTGEYLPPALSCMGKWLLGLPVPRHANIFILSHAKAHQDSRRLLAGSPFARSSEEPDGCQGPRSSREERSEPRGRGPIVRVLWVAGGEPVRAAPDRAGHADRHGSGAPCPCRCARRQRGRVLPLNGEESVCAK